MPLKQLLTLEERSKCSLRICTKANGNLWRQAWACSILGYCCLLFHIVFSGLWCIIWMPDLHCPVKWWICMLGFINWAWQELSRGQCLPKPRFPGGHWWCWFLPPGTAIMGRVTHTDSAKTYAPINTIRLQFHLLFIQY